MAKRRIDWLKLLLELLVVFIGVTMGFLLNNWATKFKQTKQETFHLVNLIEDLKINKAVLTNQITEYNIWLIKADTLLNQIDRNTDTELDSLDVILNLINKFEFINYQKNAFQMLQNSGDFNFIGNFELKENINLYYSDHLFKVSVLDKELESIYKEYFVGLLMEYPSNERNNKTFANKASRILSLNNDYKKLLIFFYKKAQSESTSLIKQIDDYSHHIHVNYRNDDSLKKDDSIKEN